MSLLLRIIGNVIFYSVLAVIVLTLLTWLTRGRKSDQKPPSSGEWPEGKATYIDRISARRDYSSSRQDLKDEQERRRA
jgi:hypothetical protein